MSDERELALVLYHLEWHVRALAQPVSVQLAMFPSFVGTAEELAVGFGA